jgi:HSP90 family molecular chaperone
MDIKQIKLKNLYISPSNVRHIQSINEKINLELAKELEELEKELELAKELEELEEERLELEELDSIDKKIDSEDIIENDLNYKNIIYKPVIECMKNILGNHIDNIILSYNIGMSPAILISDQYEPNNKKMMIINPDHKIIKGILQQLENNYQNSIWSLKDMILMIYDGALLASGFELLDTISFSTRLNKMMAHSFYNNDF